MEHQFKEHQLGDTLDEERFDTKQIRFWEAWIFLEGDKTAGENLAPDLIA